MGEKGNGADAGSVTGALGDPSVLERVTTTTTQTVVGASEDLVAKLKDTAIDHGAAAIIAEAQGRLGRRETAEEPPAQEASAGTTAAGHDPSGDADDDPAAR